MRHVAAEPEVTLSKADILDEEEKQKLLIEFNNTQTEFMEKHKLFHQLFEEKAEETPHQTAVIEGTQQISYSKLNERANRLALTLHRYGFGHGKKSSYIGKPFD